MSGMKAVAGAAAPALLVFAAGCASNQPVPSASIEQAEQRIEEAERADAQRYATRALNTAREQLLQAREAQEEGEDESAARLAERAELDAAYAIARSDNQTVQAAVDELRATLATLESELARQSGSGADGSPEDQDIDVSVRDDGLLDTSPSAEPPDEDPLGPDPQSESDDDIGPEPGPGL